MEIKSCGIFLSNNLNQQILHSEFSGNKVCYSSSSRSGPINILKLGEPMAGLRSTAPTKLAHCIFIQTTISRSFLELRSNMPSQSHKLVNLSFKP